MGFYRFGMPPICVWAVVEVEARGTIRFVEFGECARKSAVKSGYEVWSQIMSFMNYETQMFKGETWSFRPENTRFLFVFFFR